ncbi:MAG: BatA and WFA domain-containing protein [Patescibacteria group bacterium]|nr:BatA and WFA domain-containing protein [Patescibacteria group bacterium]
MNFLFPSFLYFLPFISLPFLIHFFTRKKHLIIPFSSLRFLKLLESHRIRNLRIQQLLLLIFRTLVLGFLILAFARPVLRGSINVTEGHSKTSAVFIIDNSMSMGVTIGNKRYFEEVQDRAKALLKAFAPEDEIAVWYPAGMNLSAISPVFDSKSRALSIIGQGTLTYQRTDLSAVLSAAHKILETRANVNKEIFVFSDLQATEFDFLQLQNDSLQKFQISNFLMSPLLNIPKNAGVGNVQIQTQIIEAQKEIALDASIIQKSTSLQEETLLNLYLEGQRLAQQTIRFSDQMSLQAHFTLLPAKAGLLQGFIEVEPDALDEDNRGYFVLRVPEKIRVLLLSPQTDGSNFIKYALQPQENTNTQGFEVTTEEYPFTKFDTAEHDVLILHDIPRFTAAGTLLVQEYLRKGKGVLIAMSDRFDVLSFNTHIAAPLGISSCTSIIGDSVSPSGYFTIDKIELSHPIFQGMFENKPDRLGPIHFYSIASFQQDSDKKAIIALQNQMPLLVEYERLYGKLLIFSGGMSTRTSDFPLKGFFPSLINRIIRYLAFRQGFHQQEYTVAKPLNFVLNKRAQRFEILRPDGEIVRPSVEVQGDKFEINYDNTDVPGIYSLIVDGETADKVPVNTDPRESDTTPVELSQLYKVLPYVHVVPEEPQAALSVIEETRYGVELRLYFLGIAVLFLLAEMWVARYRQEETPLQSIEEITEVNRNRI